MSKQTRIQDKHLAEMREFAANACATKGFSNVSESAAVRGKRLARYLDSFLQARWGRDIGRRQRAEPRARPWGTEAIPAHLDGLTWVMFLDDLQPTAVGIRAIVRFSNAPMFFIIYWSEDGSQTHEWRCDPNSGWQHVSER